MLRAFLAAMCGFELIDHQIKRQRQFRAGRRVNATGRQADPPGWGYVTVWDECLRCGYKRSVSVRECWLEDYEKAPALFDQKQEGAGNQSGGNGSEGQCQEEGSSKMAK